ncbi:SRPBCC family protein [Oscillatoria sp. FACHB-1406]|uniref:SRPBCC family protein n=1 Tax=Oscillatoria sp. FACHB-1406 TaxID=2692846 RepID=UPI001685720C|nr:SRPBCC family protein [Oscillatoria sp. FACHB-1406]MBD2578198.1 cyclase [Oscillatoria sp. FACHB-1406]
MEITSSSNSEPERERAGNISETERWGSLIAGGAMILTGLSQRSLRGALLAVAGGGLAYHGATADKSLPDRAIEATGLDKPIRVEKTVAIQNKSPEELYRFWRNFENLPAFMKHLKSVTVLDERRSHWVADAPLDNAVEWDAVIASDRENQLITWMSVEGSQVEHSGLIRFRALPHGRGTEVKMVIEYSVPGGQLTSAIAKLFGESPEQQIGEDLRRFKMLMEAGEIATTEGQPTGQR